MSTAFSKRLVSGLLISLLLAGHLASAQASGNATAQPAPSASTVTLDKLLDRVSQRVSDFLDLFSNVKCVEQVKQEKIKPDGKIQLAEQSSYDYLVILTNAGGDLSLDESRLPLKVSSAGQKKDISMLTSNGFATLFLVFHPYYVNSFEFTDAGATVIDDHPARKIHFEHIRNMRSIAALALRGREYPMELSGMAWVDPENGNLMRIEAGIGSTLEDIGMKSLQSEVTYAPVVFQKDDPIFWFPIEAVVEVESPKQHWRNTHRFTDYKRFSVSTEEKVATK